MKQKNLLLILCLVHRTCPAVHIYPCKFKPILNEFEQCGDVPWFGLACPEDVYCVTYLQRLYFGNLQIHGRWVEGTQIDLSLGMGDAVHFTGGLNLSEKWLAEIGAS